MRDCPWATRNFYETNQEWVKYGPQGLSGKNPVDTNWHQRYDLRDENFKYIPEMIAVSFTSNRTAAGAAGKLNC